MNRCKSCNAEIKWIKMASGKSMPVDSNGISYSEVLPPYVKGDNVLTLVTDRGTIVKTMFDPAGDKVGYTSHFATCPYANYHRNRR